MTIRVSFSDKTIRVAVELNGGIESLVTELPQRTWVGLTDEEIMEMLNYGQYGRVPQYARNFVDAIESALREKNK